MKNNKVKSILIWTLIFFGFAVIAKHNSKSIVAFAVIYCCIEFGVLFYKNRRKNTISIPTKKYDVMDLKDVKTLESILKTNKLAYQFEEDKDALGAFMMYTFLGGQNVDISNDMARLFEKHLRVEDFYLDIDEDTEQGKEMRNNQKDYIFVPFIDVMESLEHNRLVFDMYKPSAKVPKIRLDGGIKDFDLIACKVDEYCEYEQFIKGDILIVEQGKYVNEVITYKSNDKEITVYGRILFAQHIALSSGKVTVENLEQDEQNNNS